VKSSGADAWSEPLYIDTSALVKLFVHEPESQALNQAILGKLDIVVSDLALTEMASALGRRAREGVLSVQQARRIHREALKLAAVCRHVELTPPIHRRAERLLLSISLPLRSLDALHVAVALDANAATVVSFDPRLREAAITQGLFVAP